MRPVIILDAAYLKGDFLGTNYLAVAMDGDNHILPLAYGVGKAEDTVSWTWFLEQLKECIKDKAESLTFISDGAGSIASSIRTIFPTAFHGRCCRHLLMNMRAKGGRKEREAVFWKACKAYRVSDFNEYMEEMRASLPKAAESLEKLGFEKWARCHSLGIRYNYMTSNSAESVNALTRYARKLPICMLIDFFRTSIQQWYFERRETAGKH